MLLRSHHLAAVLVCALCLLLELQLAALLPARDFRDKSVAELITLLASKDATDRQCAAAFLGFRYQNPNLVRSNQPIARESDPKPQLAHSSVVVAKLSGLLETDPYISVRLCAIQALENLRFRADTVRPLDKALGSTEALVRIRAAQSLIRISKEYEERLPKKVIPTLLACLDKNGNPEILWQTAYVLGQLESKGKAAIPALEELRTHQSKKVRTYAGEALAKINPQSNE